LSYSSAEGTFLSALMIGSKLRIICHKSLGIVIELVSEISTADMRDCGVSSYRGAIFKQVDIQPCEFDELFAITILRDTANSGEDNSRSGHPYPW
jgi:hypothetical protein